VQGINPPFPLAELRQVQRLERETLELFRKDPHGAHPPLSTKRAARQWSSDVDVLQNITDPVVVESLRRLLENFERTTFSKSLPWTEDSS
jgi:hypothetical protein